MKRFIETEGAIPTGFSLRVVHLHAGNTSKTKRSGHEMVTLAEIRSDSTGEVIARGKAYCSKKEKAPSRKVGRAVAVGRALRDFWESAAQAA